MKSTDTFNRTLDLNAKLKFFVVGWLLVEEILFWGVRSFFLILNNDHVIHMGQSFDPTQIIWSDTPFWNIIRSLITCLFAFGFGVAYAYMARKVRESDKVTISLANAILAVFGTIILSFLIYALPEHYKLHDFVAGLNSTIKSSGTLAVFIVVQLVGAAICTYVGLNQGTNWSEHLPEDSKGRLLGIKWYHYLWLWFGLEIYVTAFLYLMYITLHALRLFLAHFSFWDLIGATTSKGDSHGNSVSSLSGALVFVYIIGVIIFYMIKQQHEILTGESKTNIYQKIGVSILVSVIVPLALALFTVIGNDSVR